jgi:alkanesulfonate monooxygenase SsuD/methylene tetrahydromethanopterin reductase-like flavin-dependent oxidoreductase (luciferase family)
VGTAIAILPLYHPVRFVADGAIPDILSCGEFITGVAAGYREYDFKIFGVNLKERASRMNESLEIISRLWQGEQLNFNGRYFNVTRAATCSKATASNMGGKLG